MKRVKLSVIIILCLLFLISGCAETPESTDAVFPVKETVNETISGTEKEAADESISETEKEYNEKVPEPKKTNSLTEIPPYSGKPYAVINNNQPWFTADEYKTQSFESYSELDSLKRCGVAYANIGKDIMPTEERGSIGSVKPSGWQTVKYDNVDGKYLYNRCHLIGFQLSGENANEKNLITGTRYMNVQGMLPFENMVADYVKETNNHVLLRVTPVFERDNLVASGVLMEAFSVEDEGDGVCFNVFCYNVQPGINIDYSDGSSKPAEEIKPESDNNIRKNVYVGNKNTKKFHYPTCTSAGKIKETNKISMECTREEAINEGYTPCGICKP